MKTRHRLLTAALLPAALVLAAVAQPRKKIDLGPLDVTPKPIATDKAAGYDHDLVYVRTPRTPDKKMMFTEANHPVHMDPGGDLMLLHPDGSEEVLVAGGEGSPWPAPTPARTAGRSRSRR